MNAHALRAGDVKSGHETANGSVDCFVLHASGAAFGIRVEAVQTIFRVSSITPVPLGPSIIAGLVNLRGKTVIAISLEKRLANDEPIAFAKQNPVVSVAAPGIASILAVAIEHNGETFALLVDAVGDVMNCTPEQRIAAPSHVAASRAKLTSDYYRTDVGIVPVLDLAALFDINTDRRDGRDRRVSQQPDSHGASL